VPIFMVEHFVALAKCYIETASLRRRLLFLVSSYAWTPDRTVTHSLALAALSFCFFSRMIKEACQDKKCEVPRRKRLGAESCTTRE